MSSFTMDWNPKTPLQWDWENPPLFSAKASEIPKHAQQAKPPLQWDWENPPQFSAKASEIPKHAQQAEWGIGGIDNGSVHSSGGGACSGSELGNGCSAKSSISASIDSSLKAGNRLSEFNFEAVEGFPNNLTKYKEISRVEDTGTSPVVASVGSREPQIGLKLGKRTYFEDVSAGSNIKNSSSVTVMQSTAVVKKSRMSHQSMQSSYCQVEGCNVDLAAAKDYHRKHRVCESHSKCPRVIISGQERRFCQQCSRFHDLSEFDQKKRSCRRRLSDHNARRRKPQPDTISFSSARLSSPFYDNRQQMNLLLNRAPFSNIRPTASSTWEDSFDFKLTQAKGSWIKSTKAGGSDGLQHFPSSELSNTVSTLHRDLNRLLPFKGTTAEVLNQGLEASVIASNLDGAHQRALSLLSTDSWGSADSGPTSSLVQLVHANHTSAAQPAMHAVNSITQYWQDEQPQVQQSRMLPFALHSNGSQFQEVQLLKTPYDSAFFNSNQIH